MRLRPLLALLLLGTSAPLVRAPIHAETLLREGKAEEALASALKTPGAEGARIAGNAALTLAKPEVAARHFDRALALAPRSSVLWSDIARFRLATGNAGGAIEAARHAIVLNPADAGAALLNAQLMRGQLGPRASLSAFEQAVALRPETAALVEYAATLAEAGQARAALAVTRDVLAIDRANPRAYFIQAVIAARAGRFGVARALLYRTGGRIDAEPAVMLLRGALEIEAGSNEQAITRFEDLLRARPLHFPARRLLALARWRSGDADGTANTLAPLTRRADADPWSLSLAGRALEAQGNRLAAAALLDRAALAKPGPAQSFGLASWPGADPANADVTIPRISQLVEQGRAGEAVALAAAVRARSPGSPGAWVAFGDALLASGTPVEAANAYARAANIDFSESVALRLIAALDQAGRRREAAQASSLFLAQNPRSIAALVLAANAAMATGRWERARVLFEHLEQRLGPRNLSARAGAAAARQRLASGEG